MRWLLVESLWLLLAVSVGATSVEMAHAATPSVVEADEVTLAADRIAAQCQTGTLIFSEGDCLAVRIYTWNSITHVGVVVFEGDVPFVYDSTSGIGVRKLTLRDYLAAQGLEQVHLFHPCRRLTDEESRSLQGALDRQLGRPYSVSHHLTGRPCSGVHCAEYVTEALVEIDWLRANNPAKVSPASLLTGIVEYRVYTAGETVPVPVLLEPIAEPDGWCARTWWQTKRSLAACGSKLSGWVLCR